MLDLIDLIPSVTLKSLTLAVILVILLWTAVFLIFQLGIILVVALYLYLLLEKRDYYGFNLY